MNVFALFKEWRRRKSKSHDDIPNPESDDESTGMGHDNQAIKAWRRQPPQRGGESNSPDAEQGKQTSFKTQSGTMPPAHSAAEHTQSHAGEASTAWDPSLFGEKTEDKFSEQIPPSEEETATVNGNSDPIVNGTVNKKVISVVAIALGLSIGLGTYISSMAKEAEHEAVAKKPKEGPDETQTNLSKTTVQAAIKSEKSAVEESKKLEKQQADTHNQQAQQISQPSNDAQVTNGATYNSQNFAQNQTQNQTQNQDKFAAPSDKLPPMPSPIERNAVYNPVPISGSLDADGDKKIVQIRSSGIVAIVGDNNRESGQTNENQRLSAGQMQALERESQILQGSTALQAALDSAAIRQEIARLKMEMANSRNSGNAMANSPSSPMSLPTQTAPSVNSFGNDQTAIAEGETAPSIKMTRHTSQTVLHQGSIIPAVLISGINSDLDGDVRAMVTEDVYDSVDGRIKVIPRGSKLVASYGGEVKMAQERIGISFSRVILPNGDYVMLSQMRGVDTLGYSGLDADVDNHFIRQFGSAMLLAFIGFQADRHTTLNVEGTSTAPVKFESTAGSIIKDVSGRILSRYMDIKPTLRIDPGQKIKVFVNKDIFIGPYKQ